MNKFYKTVIVSIFTVAFAATSAMAFQGFSIGIVGTKADFDTTGTEREGNNKTAGQESHTTTVSESVDFPSMFIEYTVGNAGGLGMTIGIEHIPGAALLGAKSRTDSEAPADRDSDDGTYSGKAEISDHTTVYIEPTFMANDSFGIYLKGGAAHVTVNSLESLANGTDSSTYGDEKIWGVEYGIGVKALHENGLFLKLERTETKYQTVTLGSTTGNQNTITAKPEASATTLAIGYNF